MPSSTYHSLLKNIGYDEGYDILPVKNMLSIRFHGGKKVKRGQRSISTATNCTRDSVGESMDCGVSISEG